MDTLVGQRLIGGLVPHAGWACDQQVIGDLVTLYDAWGRPDQAALFRTLLQSE